MPCRSSRSSASARRSGSPPANSSAASDQRPCVAVGRCARLQGDERLAKRRAAVDAVPAREEATERSLLHGLDLPAQGRERRTPEPPQDVGIAPLALAAAGAELATDELLLALESA